MNATAEQIERAKTAAEKSKMPFEMVLKMIVKQDEKKGWNQMSSKEIEKANLRNVEPGEATFDFAERMRENARKNLPSSMR